MIEAAGVGSKTELDAKLRTMGSSLEATRQSFFERSLAQQWVQQHVKEEEEITHEEMLAYYRDHSADFENRGQGALGAPADELCQVSRQAGRLRGNCQAGEPTYRRMPHSQKSPTRFPTTPRPQMAETMTGRRREAWFLKSSTRRFSACPSAASARFSKTTTVFILSASSTQGCREGAVSRRTGRYQEEDQRRVARLPKPRPISKSCASTPVWTVFDDLPAS